MSTVYTKRLFAAHAFSGAAPAAICPAGKTWVVLETSIWANPGGVGTFAVVLAGGYVINATPPMADANAHGYVLTNHQVVVAGESLLVQSFGVGSFNAVITGWELNA